MRATDATNLRREKSALGVRCSRGHATLGITSILSLVLAENFLKSSPKCLLACLSSGTRGKVQNWGFFWPKSVKIWQFLTKIQFF